MANDCLICGSFIPLNVPIYVLVKNPHIECTKGHHCVTVFKDITCKCGKCGPNHAERVKYLLAAFKGKNITRIDYSEPLELVGDCQN